jgi:hypothetical protein
MVERIELSYFEKASLGRVAYANCMYRLSHFSDVLLSSYLRLAKQKRTVNLILLEGLDVASGDDI